MPLAITITNSPTKIFSSDLRSFKVENVPTDTTPVTVSMSDGATTIYSTTLYSISGTINILDVNEILNAYLEPLQKKHFTLSISASHPASPSAVTAQYSLTVVFSRICLDKAYTTNFCANYMARNFMTLSRNRIIEENRSYTLILWSDTSHTATITYRAVYDDSSTLTATSTAVHAAGFNSVIINTSTLPASLRPSGKALRALSVLCDGHSATMYVSRTHHTALTYSNLFKNQDTLHIDAVVSDVMEREAEEAQVNSTLKLYDVRPQTYKELTLTVSTMSVAYVLQDIIVAGHVNVDGEPYVITSHEWKRNGTSGEMPTSISLTLYPESTIYQLPHEEHSGVFSDEYNEVYD